MTLKRFLIVISFIIGSVSAGAQVFPVQVITQLMPPFTPYLSDYTAPGAQKFMVQIRVIDPTLTDYTCKLRITIEGVNVTIRTKQTFVSQPITLEGGGTPQVFYGEDLIEYFNPNALDFSGFSRSQYEQGAKLKEGVYRFSVEVLDYNRSTVVSNKGGAVAWIILNDPPILNLPRNNSRTTIIDPTNIPFTWTPRHTGSPNASFTTEYKFRMVEVWPITRNPYDAFLSQPTLFETTTDLTQIVYGMAEPALLPGRKYAWQVQAVDAEGRDLFKNQGKSEVFVFQYGEALGLPDGLYLQNAGPSLLNIRWEAPTGGLDPTGYRIQYRPHNNRKTDKWYELTATDLSKTIDKLQPETEYEVQVRSELNSQFSNYASPQVFKTSPAATGEFACNSNVQPPPLPTNSTPAPKLKPGDVIKAGGYDVHVRKVTSNGSTYTGEGGAEIPYLMGAKVSVTFKDISVNEQFWLTAGEIKTVWNANSIFLKTIEKDVKSEEAAEVGNTNVTVATAEELVIIEGTIIVTVTKNSDGDIVVYTSNGNEKVLPKGKSYAVVDEAGNGYVVDKEGNIAKTTATEAQDALARGNRTYATNALHFEKGAGTYGYDKKKYDALAQYYQQLDGGQYIDWKSVPSSNTDAVDAVIDGANYDPKNIRFELNSTPVTPSATIGKKITLNVQGKVDGSVEELLAMHKAPGSENEEVLGKLNVASYDEVHGNLVIVPVNKAEFPIDKDILAKKLTEIYKQAIADWRVSLAEPITVPLDEKFNDGESGALTNYTDDMKMVINAYGKVQDNTYYIFLVTNSKSGTTLGYMPRSKQAGFVFVDKLNSNTIVNTIAHELGHGAFNLQHTFKEFPGLAKGSTDNIMDYNNNTGTTLYKHQWDYVHDPQRVIGLFEDDEDGALKKLNGTYTIYINDSVMTQKKIFVNNDSAAKLYLKFDPVAGDTSSFIYCKVIYRPEWSKKDILSPVNSWQKIKVNVKVACSIDSLSDGKYVVLFKDKSEKVDTVNFFVRSKKYDFACVVCGRDLTVTLDKLTQMALGKAIDFTEEDVKLMSDLMKKAGFNSCKSHVHFFSQSAHETEGFTKFVESTGFSINGFYSGKTFQSNCNTKILYNQSFWDDKQYKSYFSVGPLFETSTDTTAKKKFLAEEGKIKKYEWSAAKASKSDFASCLSVITEKSDTIKYPTAFKSSSKIPANVTFYKNYTLSNDEKLSCNKRLYNLLYATFLGNGTTDDGYNYRGRGFVHLTGKDNYKNVSNTCNSFFKTDFDFQSDYEKLTTEKRYIIYSAIAYYLNKKAVKDLHTKTCYQVTKIVNGATNGYDDAEHSKFTRLSLFSNYKKDVFYGCNIE